MNEIDTKATARSLRPVALGRKNGLCAGSGGGERAAAPLAPIETAPLKVLDPEDRLRDSLARIADHPIRRVRDQPS
ncbi:hypothetical protein [Microvirga sp. TS319]|uniref:hypothetical protein n=1 Tax=Microvirga sp. TS319 TaxID=3241165 RepID=UPI00351A21A0